MEVSSEDKNLNELEKDTEKVEGMNIDTDEESPIDVEKLEDQEFENLKDDSEEDSEVFKLKTEKSRLQDENKKLSNELEAIKDRLLRTTAEYENYRKRTVKEKEGIYTDAVEDVLKTMLPVLDNLERAVAVDGSVEDLKKGIEMTIRQFKDSLEKLQVEEISTDTEFDPNIHNAVMHIEDEKYGKNSIVEVFQKGYRRANKVLRHSMVKVAN